MLIDHQDQQIVRRKTRNLELCFGTNVGTNQAKIEKISISRAIRFGFLRSLVSAIRYKANKINWRENFKITFQILQVLTPKFHSNSVSALCEG